MQLFFIACQSPSLIPSLFPRGPELGAFQETTSGTHPYLQFGVHSGQLSGSSLSNIALTSCFQLLALETFPSSSCQCFIHSFIHSLKKHLLSTYFVPGTMAATGYTAIAKQIWPCIYGSWREGDRKKQVNKNIYNHICRNVPKVKRKKTMMFSNGKEQERLPLKRWSRKSCLRRWSWLCLLNRLWMSWRWGDSPSIWKSPHA